MSREQINNLINQLSNIFKIPEFKLDENGFCSLTFDEKIVLNFDYFEENDELFLYTPLGKPQNDRILECYQNVLIANLFWHKTDGSTIAVEKLNKNLIIFNKVELQDLNIDKLLFIMENFINCAERWYDYINSNKSLDAAIQNNPEAASHKQVENEAIIPPSNINDMIV